MRRLVAACASGTSAPAPDRMLGEGRATGPRAARLRLYTQTARFLATYVNQRARADRRDDSPCSTVAHRRGGGARTQQLRPVGRSAGVGCNRRRTSQAPGQNRRRRRARSCWRSQPGSGRRGALLAESLVLADMISDLVSGSDNGGAARSHDDRKNPTSAVARRPRFFLELAHGRCARHNHVSIIVDAANRAILLEMNLGESHSAIAIEPISSTRRADPARRAVRVALPAAAGAKAIHEATAAAACHPARPASCGSTTLAVPPEIRRRTFSRAGGCLDPRQDDVAVDDDPGRPAEFRGSGSGKTAWPGSAPTTNRIRARRQPAPRTRLDVARGCWTGWELVSLVAPPARDRPARGIARPDYLDAFLQDANRRPAGASGGRLRSRTRPCPYPLGSWRAPTCAPPRDRDEPGARLPPRAVYERGSGFCALNGLAWSPIAVPTCGSSSDCDERSGNGTGEFAARLQPCVHGVGTRWLLWRRVRSRGPTGSIPRAAVSRKYLFVLGRVRALLNQRVRT